MKPTANNSAVSTGALETDSACNGWQNVVAICAHKFYDQLGLNLWVYKVGEYSYLLLELPALGPGKYVALYINLFNQPTNQLFAIKWYLVRLDRTLTASHDWTCVHQILSVLWNKQRVLMHGHQGWNVRHGLCHIYMIYVYIWVVYSFCLFCCLFIIVTTQFVALYKPCKPKPKFR